MCNWFGWSHSINVITIEWFISIVEEHGQAFEETTGLTYTVNNMTTSTYFYKLKEQAVTIELFFSIVQEHRQTFEETTLLENIDNLLKKQQY